MSRTPAGPTVLELWLARKVVGPSELLSLRNDEDVKIAASSITSSMRGMWAGDEMFSVKGQKVEYEHLDHGAGTVTVRRLLQVAMLLRTDEKHQRVRACYRLYIDGYGQHQLDRAAQAWWIEKPNEPFAAALCAIYASRNAAAIEEARERYGEVWAAEHDALAALRGDELVDAWRAA